LWASPGQPKLGRFGNVCYVLADGNYDANGLFDLAGEPGYQPVLPLTQPGAVINARGCGAAS
jgi:hypothetical protein